MAKKGRPFVYQSDAEKPVTVSLRLPRDVYEQARRYVGMRPPMTLTDLLLDGLRLRLETPADPRDMILSDDNTVMQQIQEMVDAAVQKTLGQGSTASPALDTPMRAPAPAASTDMSHDSNTVIQETQAKHRGRKPVLRPGILALLDEHPEGLTAAELKVYLETEKHIGDTLSGMARDGLLVKLGKGQGLRYQRADAVEAPGRPSKRQAQNQPDRPRAGGTKKAPRP